MNGIGGIGQNNQIFGKGREVHPQATPEPISSDEAPAVTVTLSPEAQAALGQTPTTVEEPTGPGKSGSSPAHRARAAIADFAELADMPFGKIVSMLAKGLGFDSLLTPPDPKPTEIPPQTEETTGEETPEPTLLGVPPEPEPPVEEASDPAFDAAQLALDLLSAPEEEDEIPLDLLTPDETT